MESRKEKAISMRASESISPTTLKKVLRRFLPRFRIGISFSMGRRLTKGNIRSVMV